MPEGKLKPNETWGRKRARHRRYIVSGPPRDIVGLYDDKQIDNYYQRITIRELKERDSFKFLGTKDERPPEELPLPLLEQKIPNNQPLMFYHRRGTNAARLHQWGLAYWYFIWAAKKSKTHTQRKRYEEAAWSNLKTWTNNERRNSH